jgi:protoporphyrinogen oxidase
MELAVRGAFIDSDDIGYNTTFIYPKNGLNCLINKMVECSDVHFGKKVVKIDTKNKKIYFSDETTIAYDRIISTLPLNKMLELTGIKLREKSSPSPGVLVVNIGATKGKKCPKDHWIYIPKSRAGFHRVGFYSNVDQSFLPKTKRDKGTHVSIYVEKAFVEGHKPSLSEISKLTKEITKELKEWQWIKKVEVNDPTWVETAYTWSWPNSVWSEHALKELEMVEIQQVGRYGKWIFQGIAESIRDGLAVGAKYKK